LPEDSVDPQGRELLNRRFFRVRRHVAECRIRVKRVAPDSSAIWAMSRLSINFEPLRIPRRA
jgi:hypothetical protein